MEWDDPTKYSHKNKPLKKHLEEVEYIFKNFAKFYNIEKWAFDLTLPIVRYHDNGKLNPAWRYYDPKKPLHSEYSIRYLKEHNLLKELEDLHGDLYPLIPYLILKHHSSLYDGTKSVYKDLCRDVVRRQIRKQSIEKRVELVDSFGLFKIADCLSASNRTDFRPKDPGISVEAVLKILSKRTGNVDERRWTEQKQLMNLPNSTLLTAYTGWGKTDSSLLFCSDGQNIKKVFYLFPMITAINKFHEKLEMSGYVNDVEKYFYLYEYEIATRQIEPEDESHEAAMSSFMASHFLNSIMLTTVDQFLLSFLQLGKYYMKRVMFRNAVIIVDEIHLLNPKMLSLLLQFFRTFIPIYRFKVLFMSATFSKALMRIITEHIPSITALDFSEEYRALLRVKYTLDTLDRMILDEIDKIERLSSSNKVLVVANTVESAILIYRRLEERIPSSQLILLHGKFMYRDRLIKEQNIEDLKDTPHVLVTTQVCEVSLDVSYDIMFTELAPLPSLVQRFGRVNRYRKTTDVDNVHIHREYRKNYSERYYPYEDKDMAVAKEILKRVHPIKSEYDLIEEFNNVENYDELLRRMQEANGQLDFKALWENDNRTAYFFSFKLDEERVKERLLLEFRDSFTVNVLPHPECIENHVVKEDLISLLNGLRDVDASAYGKVRQILMELRGYLVSISVSQASKYDMERIKGFPIFKPDDLVYSSVYGFVKRS
jgi:CRISPR-associated endonuclease/helicase Cas3